MSLLDESPRWLMSKGKLCEAYKIVFRKSMDENAYFELEKVKATRANSLKVLVMEWYLIPKMKNLSSQTSEGNNALTNLFKAIKTGSSELIGLYGNGLLRRRLLICHFTFFMASLTYYVIGKTILFDFTTRFYLFFFKNFKH